MNITGTSQRKSGAVISPCTRMYETNTSKCSREAGSQETRQWLTHRTETEMTK